MRRSLLILAAILLALGAVEGVAYWWMHPAPAGLGEPVLVYRPGFRGQGSEVRGQEEATTQSSSSNQKSAIHNHQSSITGRESSEKSHSPAPGLTTDNRQPTTDNSSSATDNRQPTTDNSPTSTLTPLPEIYAKSAPMLRCSSGQVLHARLDESAGIHLAFFEWDGTDTGSVLEAFRHMPEACMGSIGMKLVEKAPVRTFVVRGQGTEDRLSVVSRQLSVEELSEKSQSSSNQKSAIDNHQSSITGGQGTEVRGQRSEVRGQRSEVRGQRSEVRGQLSEEELSEKSQSPAPKRTTSTDNGQPTTDNSPSPTDNRQRTTDNSSSATDNGQQTTDNSSSSTLIFDHTVFREGGGVAGLAAPIHAFRAVWVAGVSAADARKGLGGNEFDRLRTIRLKSARDRFRPAHARVIQGAVRGIPDPDLAWQAFEQAMLEDLSFAVYEK